MAYNRAKDEAWRQKCWLCRFETSGPLDETPTAVFFVPAMTKGVVAFRGPVVHGILLFAFLFMADNELCRILACL